MRKSSWVVVVIAGVMMLTGCATPSSEPAPDVEPTPEPTPIPDSEPVRIPAWMEIELTDVATGQKFKISDFQGRPMLLEAGRTPHRKAFQQYWFPLKINDLKFLSRGDIGKLYLHPGRDHDRLTIWNRRRLRFGFSIRYWRRRGTASQHNNTSNNYPDP